MCMSIGATGGKICHKRVEVVLHVGVQFNCFYQNLNEAEHS